MAKPSRTPRNFSVALASVAAGLLLIACGGSGSPSASASSEQVSEREAEAKLADFARCMREHGIQAEIQSGTGGEHGIKVAGTGGPQQMEAAQNACKKYQPRPKKIDLSPQEKAQREEAVLKFAKCMREHGIDVHASVSNGGMQIQIHGSPGSGPNPESPAFQSAQSTCQNYLPRHGGKLGRLPVPPRDKSSRDEGAAGHSGASLSVAGG
jgi:hypothetical protein